MSLIESVADFVSPFFTDNYKYMHHKIRLFVLLFLASPYACLKAQLLHGSVFEITDAGKKEPLVGVNVYWLTTTTNATTEASGHFHIPISARSNRLVFSYLGYKSDTMTITNEAEVVMVLRSENVLKEVVVQGSSTQIDRLNPIQTEIITTRALAKAACCNLSESFETNASVNVSFADAVTGAKQIQFLGLGGQYVQTNVENIPAIRGLGSTFGLNYIPGTWIQSIDIGKGVGSVVNGYESVTGAINVELVKPDSREKVYFNTYANNFGRVEANLHLNSELSKKWSVGLLTHASTLQNKFDKNGDGFMDLPTYNQVNVINRWKYQTDKVMVQFGVKFLNENREGGQMPTIAASQRYVFSNQTQRIEFFSKTAKLYQNKPYKGLGLIINALTHDSRSKFGFVPYDGKQNTLYANLIYQSIIDNTNHQFKTGVSYMLDDYDETYRGVPRKRTESVPGVFGEYTYTYPERLTVVAGGRVDFHSLYGTFATPRLHLRYQIDEQTTLRASTGRGFRVPNPLAENYGYLVSARNVFFTEPLRPETSWNYGVSVNRTFHWFDKHWELILDYYRTDFENQMVADLEHPGEIYFYNLKGQSFSNSFQAELNIIPIKRMEIKVAYRKLDVRQSMGAPFGESRLLERMMIAPDRVLFNIGYALPYDKWKWDLTLQWNGQRRIPYLREGYVHTGYANMPIENAPAFVNLNAQVSRSFPKFEVYLGGENLTNFRQLDPIIGANDPFGRFFDAGTRAWGPVVGRMIYAGVRYKIKK